MLFWMLYVDQFNPAAVYSYPFAVLITVHSMKNVLAMEINSEIGKVITDYKEVAV